jgi:hypothetical protein
MTNKQLNLNVGLNELKSMDPIEMFVFAEQAKEIAKELERHQNGI